MISAEKSPLFRTARRYFRRGRLGATHQVIRIQGGFEDLRFRISSSAIARKADWQLTRLEKRGKREKAKINNDLNQAKELLEQGPQLYQEAIERQEQLLAATEEAGERLLQRAEQIGVIAAVATWEALNLAGNFTLFGGKLMIRGLRSLAQRDQER